MILPDSFIDFFFRNKWIISFYLGLIILIYLNRKKFEVQAKIIFLYRTKFGINAIHKFGKKYSEIIKIVGYIGIGVGFIGLIFISGIMIKSLYDLFFVPNAPAAVSPVIPGVKIPGSAIFVPFWYGIISLFIVVVVHEFSHGIVAAAHGLKIKNTGIVFFGPLIGAFVEPDEKEIKKQSDVTQYSIFAAGPFSNIILGLIAILMIGFIFTPIHSSILTETGVSFNELQKDLPAENAGLYPNMTIIKVDDEAIKNSNDFERYLNKIKPEQTITVYSDKNEEFVVKTTASPKDEKRAYLGVIGVHTATKLKKDSTFYDITDKVLTIFSTLFMWIFVLSLGIGLANLLPLGPVDGGRMLQTALHKTSGNEKKGNYIWHKVTVITIVILLILLIIPIVRSVLKL